jgi:hypothetical protein
MALSSRREGFNRAYDWFVWGYHRYYRLPTLPIVQYKLAHVD